MPFCAISNCKNKSSEKYSAKGGISYHRFPNDPIIRAKWIDATGAMNWSPSEQSTICSVHFKEDGFNETDQLCTLLPTAYPTVEVQNSPVESKRKKLSPSVSYNTVRNMKLRKRNILLKKQRLKIKQLRERYCLKQKEISLPDIISDLEQKSWINGETALILNDFTELEMVQRQSKNKFPISRSKYSPEIQRFSLALNYYAPEAHNYIRQKFKECMPGPRTTRSWYESIDGYPGFSRESLEALKLKVNSEQRQLYCCLAIDGMYLNRLLQNDGKEFLGYVDFGEKPDGDLTPKAKEALVFLVTCINSTFNIPIGYFFIENLNGEQQKNLLIACLEMLHATGVTTVAITFDNCPTNRAMALLLGCNLEYRNLKATFAHPITKEPVAILPNACHMLMSVRNAFRMSKQLLYEGQLIQWSYIDQLNDLYTKENVPAANKLQKMNCNQKIKVKLANKLFSNSVADTLEMYKDTYKLDAFKKCGATINFIRIFNNLYNILNSKTLTALSYKRPLSLENKTMIFNYLDHAEKYIGKLKNIKGQLMVKRPNQTGFVGFLVCIQSIKHLFHYLIESDRMKFLPLYRCTMNELELFFCNVRAHARCKDELSCKQFQSFYKNLITNIKPKDTDHNFYTTINKISILNYLSAVSIINVTTGRINFIECEEVRENTKKNFKPVCIGPLDFSLFLNELIIYYLGGFVVHNLVKKIKCEICLCALLSSEGPKKGSMFQYKEKGCSEICKTTELIIKLTTVKFLKSKILLTLNCKSNPTKSLILNKVLKHFIGKNIFSSINQHQFEQFPTENHIIQLIRAVAEVYVDVRLYTLQQ